MLQPDPVLDELIREYTRYKPLMDSGFFPQVTIEIRTWLPPDQRISSFGRRDSKRIDKNRISA